jgi:glycosyltransferase involved in cell wall biosynthesis
MKIVITIPAYNEEKTIAAVISDIKRVMDNTKDKDNYKILIVDDGSKDKTAEIAKKAGAVVYSHPMNYGLAEAFRTEIKICLKLGADIIVHTDADGQYLAKEIPKLIEGVKNGNDLVLGSRFKGTIEEMPFIKRLGNKAFSKVISNITRTNISDAQTGFRAFNRKIAESIPIISTHTYTQEQIIKAIKEKFKVLEVPIYFAKRENGKSRLMKGPFEYATKAFVNILRVYRDYEPLKFFGFFGETLMALGFLIALFFLYEHFTTGIQGHIGLLFLMIIFLFSGLQIILFGFLADMMKK